MSHETNTPQPIITEMPAFEPGAEVQQGPEFRSPEPTRLQKMSMRAAGMLLRQETAEDTLHELAQQGGFKQEQDGETQKYTLEDAETVMSANLYDETSKPSFSRKFKRGADFEDAIGRDVESAAARVASATKNSGPRANTRRGRVAAKLVKHASKGVGARAHTRKG